MLSRDLGSGPSSVGSGRFPIVYSLCCGGCLGCTQSRAGRSLFFGEPGLLASPEQDGGIYRHSSHWGRILISYDKLKLRAEQGFLPMATRPIHQVDAPERPMYRCRRN